MQAKSFVIIGTSAAGLAAAATLLAQDQQAQVIALSCEAEQPYNKCFLVDYVSGDKAREQLFTLRTALATNPRFSMSLGVTVLQIHPDSKTLLLNDGQLVGYEKLLMSMGGRALLPELPGSTYAGVFTFYTLADIDRLMAYSTAHRVQKAVVIGAGLSGLECAHALVSQGLVITVIERGSRILSHHTDVKGSSYIQAAARSAGVTIIIDHHVTELTGHEGAVTGVLVSDGSHHQADLVIFAVGMRPNGELAQAAGIALSGRHVIVDTHLRTNIPHIFAAGDVVVAPSALNGSLVASTTWPDAVLQGTVAAYAMLGHDRTYPGVIGHTVSHLFGYDIASCGTLGMSSRQVIVIERPECYRRLEFESGILKAYSLIGNTTHAVSVCRRALLTKQPLSKDELDTL